MKPVQNKDGSEMQVADNTPCHAGVNGALPIPYTKEELVIIDAQQAADKAIWDAGATPRNAQKEIVRLEGGVTQRRIRDAILGTDNGWLATQESLIKAERNKLQRKVKWQK